MRTNEEREITAYFEDRVRAQRAMDDLEANGIDRDEMELSDKSSGGGFWDSMKRLFTGESYEQHATGCLLTVYADRESALPVLQRYGARFGEAGSICADDADADSAQPMKLREERMSVDKRAAKEGEVTLRKDVVTEQQTIEVPVSHEEVYVSRRRFAYGEQETDAGEVSDEESITVPVMREEVSVDKRPVVTGEVSLNKRRVQEPQKVSATVRKERPSVETTGDVDDRVDDDSL